MLTELTRGFRQLVFPSICIVCNAALGGRLTYFCADCRLQLTNDPDNTCPRCSASVGAYTADETGCSSCRDEPLAFTSAFRLGRYANTLREVIVRMKQRQGDVLAECMGRLWAEHAAERFGSIAADVVIPMPLHWQRRFWRGHNQSEALSEAIARVARRPHRPAWLRRVRAGVKQATLGGAERRKNLRGVFRVARHADLKGRTVLLIDDVLTTGATASAAAGVLLDGGADQVVVAILASP